jgi:hypothetical protein
MAKQSSSRVRLLFALAALGAALGAYLITVQGMETIGRRLAMGDTPVGAIVHYLSFLSILTNGALLFVYWWYLSGGALLRWARHPTLHAFLAALILLVGVVWHVLLRPIEEVDFNAIGFHYLAPALFLLWWALRTPPTPPTYRGATWLMALTLAYAGWLLGRGTLTGDYPYDFIDVGEVGYSGALPMMVGLLFAQWLLALSLVGVQRWRARPR